MHTVVAALVLAAAAPAAKVAGPADFPSACNAQAKALMVSGFDARWNARENDARVKFKDAVAADPKCGLAKGFLAGLTPGAEGKKLLDEGAGQTAGATEAEKLWLQSMVADAAGDRAKQLELLSKAREDNPNVVQLQIIVGFVAARLEKFDVLLACATKATALDPKSGMAWNQLGYAHVNKQQWAEAVAAFTKYTEVSPNEANAHDSLADALLSSGKLDDAAAEYQKAVDAKMVLSNTGLAAVRAIKGDWAGARAAADAVRDGSTEPIEKFDALQWKAAAFAAEGKLADALKAMDEAEKVAVGGKLLADAAWAMVIRGELQAGSGKHADALKQYAAAEKAKLDGATDDEKLQLNAWRLVGVAEAQARLGKIAEADKAAQTLDALFKATPADVEGQNMGARARGAVLLAKKDFKGAVETLSKCTDRADLCRVSLAEAQEKAGDAAAAQATRDALLAVNHRTAIYVMARTRLAAAAPGKKVAVDAKKK